MVHVLDTEKQVYVFINDTKRAIQNQQAFFNHGYEFSDVQSVANKEDLDSIPTGENLFQ